jgi:hypothetical protein
VRCETWQSRGGNGLLRAETFPWRGDWKRGETVPTSFQSDSPNEIENPPTRDPPQAQPQTCAAFREVQNAHESGAQNTSSAGEIAGQRSEFSRGGAVGWTADSVALEMALSGFGESAGAIHS